MSAPSERYPALFETALPDLAGARHAPVREWRETSFERFLALGFPGPKVEAWKYTSVRQLARAAYGLAPAVALSRADVAPFLLDEPRALRLVFVNGRLAPALSDDLSDAPASAVQSLAAALEAGRVSPFELGLEAGSERAFSALNAAFATDGCLLRLADGGALAGPVQLLFVSLGDDQPVLISPRNVVVLGAGARLHLVETHVDMGGPALTNLVNRFVVGQGAELDHDRLQVGLLAGSLIGKTHYRISADARLTQSLATLGGGLVRNEVEAVIEGPRIALGLNGLYLGRERQHIDNTIQIEHASPGSTSDQFYKGVLDGHAQAVFAGRIVVQRDAQKTNAYQANNNLLLSADAEIDTKPELEIFADDVKCSHGATAGELDERALFYLRSRGIEPESARSLLTYAFADEVLERFRHPAVAAQARRELLRWLPGGSALEELL